jgi:hypothetical protein
MATSIFSRKRDLVYLIYFCIAVPVGFSMYFKHPTPLLISLSPHLTYLYPLHTPLESSGQ